MWVRVLSLGTALFSRVVTRLAYADCIMTLASCNQPIGDEFLPGGCSDAQQDTGLEDFIPSPRESRTESVHVRTLL
jgi:hypothetical protein